MTKSNVIDLGARRANQDQEKTETGDKSSSPIVDMTERRQEILSEERRQVKRTILTGFLGAFIILPQRGLVRVAIHDISEDGLSFDTEVSLGHFKKDEEVAMRVYMNHKTYFPFTASISNIRDIREEGVTRHGVKFLKGTVNEKALFHFIKFIENVSASLQTDSGDVMVSNLQD